MRFRLRVGEYVISASAARAHCEACGAMERFLELMGGE